MSTHVKPAPRPESLLGAWHTQVAETAAWTPWLVQDLIRRKSELLPKFAAYYQQLHALPRRVRRMLQGQWKRSLAGVALLLALGNEPALAAIINVTGGCTLVDAITAANTDTAMGSCSAGSGADTLVLDATSTHTLNSVNNTTYGANGLPVVTSAITIEGNGSTIERGAGAPPFRLLTVGSAGNLTLQDTTISGGSAFRGGGLYNYFGAFTLINSTVSGNAAGSCGGGVSNYYGTATITSSTISDNTANIRGGGVDTKYGTVTITNSTIAGNSAELGGGGVFNGYATLTMTNSTVAGNTAGNGGGGVYNGGGTVALSHSTITGNSSGGVHNDRGLLTLANSTITGNSGGGVYNLDTLTLTYSTIMGNSGRSGVSNHGALTLTNSTVMGNTASFFGGGVSNGPYDTLTLVNSTITGNSAHSGGGVFNYNFGTVTLTNSTITGNTAGYEGGGVFNDGGNYPGALTLAHTLVAGNTASSAAEIINSGGVITANNFNLFGYDGLTNVQAFQGFAPGATDLTATSDGSNPTALTDILDTTLQDNGGPTLTHALVSGSPAIDASPADAYCESIDQRGVSRPQGVACDIGAFEAEGGPEPDHDLAVVKVSPLKKVILTDQVSSPKAVTLPTKESVQSKTVKVQLQNQGEVDETIPDAATLALLVQVDLESLDTVNDCPDLAATLDASKLKFPLTLKAGKTPPKGKKLTVAFTVTFDGNECIPDPGKSSKKDPGHEDYRPRASADLSAMGETDVDPTDNTLQGQLIDVIDKP
jgi:hypothetical protein